MRRAAILAVIAVLSLPSTLRPQEVTLPLERFDDLRARAGMAPSPPPPPAAPYALESAELDIVAGPSSATVETRLTVTVLGEKPVAIAIPAIGQLVDVRLGALDGRVETGPGAWVLHATGAGRHVAHLSSVVVVAADAAAIRPVRRLEMKVPPAAVVTGTLRARADVDEAEFREAVGRRAPEPRRWTFVANPGRQVQVSLTGASLLPARDRLPLAFEARSTSWLEAARTRHQLHAWVTAAVRQGRLTELRVEVPAGYEVVSATGAGVASWDVEGGVLVVTAAEPVRDTWEVAVELVGDARDETAAPVLRPLGAERVRTAVLVSATGPGRPVQLDPGSARAADPEDLALLPAAVRQRRVLVLADAARPPRYRLEWAEETRVLGAQVQNLTLDVMAGEGGRAAVQAWAEVASTGVGQVDVVFPAGFVPDTASRDGLSVLAARGPGSAAALALPVAVREGTQVVHVRGTMSFPAVPEDGRLEIPLPAFSVPVQRIAMRVVLPGGRAYAAAHASAAAVEVPAYTAAPRAGRVATTLRAGGGPAHAAEAGLWPVPPGSAVLHAAWSALTPTPEPLVVDVDRVKEKASWF